MQLKIKWKIQYTIAVIIGTVIVWQLLPAQSSPNDRIITLLHSPYPPSPIPTQSEFEAIAIAAEKGDAESQLYMGYFYANGDGIKQDYTAAATWYRKAAEQGNARAQYYLGFLYDSGVGVERDYAEAFKWYMKAVEQNDPAAHMGIAGFHFAYRKSYMPMYFGYYDIWRAKAFVLANTISSQSSFEECFWKDYHHGNKYYQNDNNIVKILLVKSNSGDNAATLYIAKMIFHAQGVSRDKILGEKFILKAAQEGNHNAAFMLGATYSRTLLIKINNTESVRNKFLAMASKSRDEPFFAAVYHFKMLKNNRKYNELSKQEIIRHQNALLELAKKGNTEAQYYLANTLLVDTNNLNESFYWEDKAASGGHCDAQIAKGVSLLYGYEIQQDMEAGKKLLDRVILSNNSEVIDKMNISLFTIRKKLKNDPIPSVVAWLQKSFENGNSTSALYLGMIYDKNNINREDSYEWYLKALKANVFAASVLIKTYSISNNVDVTNDIDNLVTNNTIYEHLLKCKKKTNMAPSLFSFPSAINGYGPSILDMLNIFSACKIDLDIQHEWILKLLNQPEWYNIKGYPGGSPSYSIQEYYWERYPEQMKYASEIDDYIVQYFKFI